MRPLLIGLCLTSGLMGCSSDSSNNPPADFAGNYSVSVTNNDNGCNYASWQPGQTAQNIQYDITQDGSAATGNLQGFANVWFLALGIGAMKGNVRGSTVSLTAVGGVPLRQSACTYFVRATADLTLTGNTINGTMTYKNETNNDASCGVLVTCTSQQTIAGSRPPK